MESADYLIMQEGGTSDMDRACRVINKLQAEIDRLRAALANPCNFAAPCGECEACERTRRVLGQRAGEE